MEGGEDLGDEEGGELDFHLLLGVEQEPDVVEPHTVARPRDLGLERPYRE